MRIPLTNVSAAMIVDALLTEWDVVDYDWQCCIAAMPPDPNNIIVVRDTGGLKKARIQRGGETILGHKLQIRVRSLTYALGYMKSKQIENALLLGAILKQVTVLTHANQEVLAEATAFSLMTPTSYLGQEEQHLCYDFSFNGFLTAMEIH